MLGTALVTSVLAVLLACSTQDGGPPPAPAASRTTEVVVFPQHAEVTRELRLDAVAGSNRVTFADLVAELDSQTLRASGEEGTRITGLEVRTLYLEKALSQEVAVLDQRLATLEGGLAAEQQALARLDEQAAFLASIKGRLAQDMGRELAAGSVRVADWQAVLEFVRAGLSSCDEQRREVQGRMAGLQAELESRRAERQDFAQRQPKQKKEVDVTFTAERAGPAAVAIHYLVASAAWKPSYDVHLDRGRQEVEIVGYGQVAQWSGEHWEDVALALAMSRPDHALALPQLTPMVASLDDEQLRKLAQEASFLSRSSQDVVSQWSEGRFKRRQDREAFRSNLEQLLRQPSQRLAQLGLDTQIIRDAMQRLVDRFAGVRYAIDRRVTIPFDSSPHKVVAFAARVPVELKYVATPALGNAVVLRGEATNTSGFPILDGTAALYADDSYIGASAVVGAARNERLSFGFGPDDALVVDRRLLSRTVKGPEAFRQSQIITFQYEITIENFNDRAVEVEVSDQIPVSKTADIAIEFLGSSLPHERNPMTGVLRWTLEVGAGATTTIAYSFSVECPENREVHWS